MLALTVNVGSSSLKMDLWNGGESDVMLRLQARNIGLQDGGLLKNGKLILPASYRDHETALLSMLEHVQGIEHIGYIGHRIVHGGEKYRAPVWIDDAVLSEFEVLVPVSPVHMPPAISVIRACAAVLSGARQLAAFDTAFHASIPAHAYTYAIPAAWRDAGIRRYGFHGIACADIVAQLGDRLRRRAVILHLGAGCSATAVQEGESIDTSMGFTPLEGLVMATRSGTVDMGALLYLQRVKDYTAAEMEAALNEESGLLGLSGLSSDMHTLLEHQDDVRARLAIDVFCYRAAKSVAEMVTALGGIDQLIFSGGIGEHAVPIRLSIARRLQFLGVTLDEEANQAALPVISVPSSKVSVHVCPVDEGRQIMRDLVRYIGQI